MTTQETPQGDPVDNEDTGKGLRAQLEKSQALVRELRTTQKNQAFKDAGFDVATGLGKAIFKEYEGDLTAEAVSEYATSEYGYKAPEGQDVHPQQQQINQQQEQLDTVSQQAGSILPPTQATELGEAEATGDYTKAMSIKAQQMESWFKGPPR